MMRQLYNNIIYNIMITRSSSQKTMEGLSNRVNMIIQLANQAGLHNYNIIKLIHILNGIHRNRKYSLFLVPMEHFLKFI